jgi:hypothetical protein
MDRSSKSPGYTHAAFVAPQSGPHEELIVIGREASGRSALWLSCASFRNAAQYSGTLVALAAGGFDQQCRPQPVSQFVRSRFWLRGRNCLVRENGGASLRKTLLYPQVYHNGFARTFLDAILHFCRVLKAFVDVHICSRQGAGAAARPRTHGSRRSRPIAIKVSPNARVKIPHSAIKNKSTPTSNMGR